MKKTFYQTRANYKFESDSYQTPEFKSFARFLKSELNQFCKSNGRTLTYSVGHFYCSGFISKGDKHVYFNIGDVRFNKSFLDHILIRTAKHTKDYTGGPNNYVTRERLENSFTSLLLV